MNFDFTLDANQQKAFKVAKATEWAKAAELIERNPELSRFALRKMMLDMYDKLMDEATDGKFTEARTAWERENGFA